MIEGYVSQPNNPKKKEEVKCFLTDVIQAYLQWHSEFLGWGKSKTVELTAYWCEREVLLTSWAPYTSSWEWQERVSPLSLFRELSSGCFWSWPHGRPRALHFTPASPMFSEPQTQFLALGSTLRTEVGTVLSLLRWAYMWFASHSHWTAPGLWANTMDGAYSNMSPWH